MHRQNVRVVRFATSSKDNAGSEVKKHTRVESIVHVHVHDNQQEVSAVRDVCDKSPRPYVAESAKEKEQM